MSQIIRLTENDLKNLIINTAWAVLINESNNRFLLTENFSRTKWGKMAMKYLRYERNMEKDRAEDVIDATCHDLEIHHANDVRFPYILGCVRILCTEGIDEQKISMLKTVLKYVASEGHQGDYDSNLNGESLRNLYDRFRPLEMQDSEALRNAVNSKQYQNNGYKIVKIETDEEACRYSGYTDWCITRGSFEQYNLSTFNQAYFCLKDGFESVPRVEGGNCPLDEYGLSMVSVIVDENGDPKYITTRWNHAHYGENHPNFHTSEQVSDIIGVNFYETFKPSNKWKELVDNALERLRNGEHPRDIFDDYYDFHDGFPMVELNGKYNFINGNGELLSERWFGYCGSFSEGFARVELNGKYNFINGNGEFLSEQWFDWCGDFSEGFVMVKLNGKYNFINGNGEFLSEQWFGDCGDFSGGFAAVELNGEYNFINGNGEFLSEQWFGDCSDFSEGFAEVELNGRWYYLDGRGNLYDRNRRPIDRLSESIQRNLRKAILRIL